MHLIVENMSRIRTQRVRSVMVPWTRVRKLLTTSSKAEVMTQIAQVRYSRWPVVESETGRAIGYLLTKDLIAQVGDAEWNRMIRPLKTVGPDDDIESTLMRMQSEGSTIYIVEDRDFPVGLITMEDILEQVVGRIEDEYPHESEVSICRAIETGAVLMELRATTREETIEELAAAIPLKSLPPGIDHSKIAEWAVERESQISTDLGIGVAIPHARCPSLSAPLAGVWTKCRGCCVFTVDSSPACLLASHTHRATEPSTNSAWTVGTARLQPIGAGTTPTRNLAGGSCPHRVSSKTQSVNQEIHKHTPDVHSVIFRVFGVFRG